MAGLHEGTLTAIEVQPDGVGSGARDLLDTALGYKPGIDSLPVSFGAITRGHGIDPHTGDPRPYPARREQPEAPAFTITTKYGSKTYLERFGRDGVFAVYLREPQRYTSDPLDYRRVIAVSDVRIESFNYSGITKQEPSTDEDDLEVAVNGARATIIWPVGGYKLTTGLTKLASVNITAGAVDNDGAIYFVTSKDATSTNPLLVYSTDGETWTEVELTDLATHDCTAVVVAGQYLMIAADTIIATYSKTGTFQSSYTASGNIAALATIDAAKIVAAGASGLLLYSEDGGGSWTSITTGVTANLTSIAIKGINTWYIGGASGTLLKYQRPAITALTLPSALSTATINSIAIPDAPSGYTRADDVYIAASVGRVHKSTDGGDNWSEVIFPQSGSGNTTAIGFTEFLGQVFYILHTNAGGDSVLYRDWSGGAGGTNNVEEVSVPTNSGLNALIVVEANVAYVGGNVHSSADMIAKVYNTD